MGKISKDSLGDRMKSYELSSESILVPKMPVVIRLDGKAFHSYTRGFKKPFDELICNTMLKTTMALCKDISGCIFGYTQSDEITLVLILPDRIKSKPYMGNRVQKIVSTTASKVTKYFNKFFIEELDKLKLKTFIEKREQALNDKKLMSSVTNQLQADAAAENYARLETKQLLHRYISKAGNAEFDSRVFNMPEWDVINNIIWRQQDAIRNSIQAVGQANFSAKELNKKSQLDILEMLKEQKGIDWYKDFNSYCKMGACIYKILDATKNRYVWTVTGDNEIRIEDNREWFAIATSLKEE